MIVDYLIKLLSSVWNFHQNQIFLKQIIENHDLMNQTLFQYPL